MTLKLIRPSMEHAALILKWENDPRYYDLLFFEGPYELKDIQGMLHSMLRHDASEIRYLIELEHEIIGIADLCEIDDVTKEAFVTILISEENRQKGFGLKAMSMLEREALSRGIEKLYAWIRNENIISEALFKKLGYQKSVEQKSLIVNGVPYIQVTLFEKCLRD